MTKSHYNKNLRIFPENSASMEHMEKQYFGVEFFEANYFTDCSSIDNILLKII
jgi:hypothetical protein